MRWQPTALPTDLAVEVLHHVSEGITSLGGDVVAAYSVSPEETDRLRVFAPEVAADITFHFRPSKRRRAGRSASCRRCRSSRASAGGTAGSTATIGQSR